LSNFHQLITPKQSTAHLRSGQRAEVRKRLDNLPLEKFVKIIAQINQLQKNGRQNWEIGKFPYKRLLFLSPLAIFID